MKYRDTERHARHKRASALSRPELRTPEGYYTPVEDKLPDAGLACTAYASDGIGPPYKLPFTVKYSHGPYPFGWFHFGNGTLLRVRVVKWRYHSSVNRREG